MPRPAERPPVTGQRPPAPPPPAPRGLGFLPGQVGDFGRHALSGRIWLRETEGRLAREGEKARQPRPVPQNLSRLHAEARCACPAKRPSPRRAGARGPDVLSRGERNGGRVRCARSRQDTVSRVMAPIARTVTFGGSRSREPAGEAEGRAGEEGRLRKRSDPHRNAAFLRLGPARTLAAQRQRGQRAPSCSQRRFPCRCIVTCGNEFSHSFCKHDYSLILTPLLTGHKYCLRSLSSFPSLNFKNGPSGSELPALHVRSLRRRPAPPGLASRLARKRPSVAKCRLPPACAGVEVTPGLLCLAGVAASQGPVLEPQWLLAVNVHLEALCSYSREPSLLVPPQHACCPCSGHSRSHGHIGTGAQENIAWAPSRTEKLLPDDSHLRPRQLEDPPEIPSRSCHLRRETD